MKSRRNVLFISADQWRFECLSAMGHPLVKTPNLDALANDGVLFRQHFCQTAPCGPARTSMLTGLYAMNHRAVLNGTPLSKRHSNIAQEVRKLGYDPVLFGYTDTSLDISDLEPDNVDLQRSYMGVLQGFRAELPYTQEMFLPWFNYLREKGYTVPQPEFEVYLGRKDYPNLNARGYSYAPPIYAATDSDTAFTTDRILDYLERNRDESWFIHAVYLRPHPPLFAPEPYNSMFDPSKVPFPARLGSPAEEGRQHPFLEQWLRVQTRHGYYWGHNVNVQQLPEVEIRQMIAAYYGLIKEVDDQIGRLILFLSDTGQLDDTLLIFTCDHGEQLGDHFLWDKGGYFDQSYHIPLIIRDPSATSTKGQHIEEFTESVDLVPTILDWLGAPPPVESDGVSLLPLLHGLNPSPWREEVHWEFDFRDPVNGVSESVLGITSEQCSLNVLRGKRYKYVHFAGLPPLFFDLENDPLEYDNKADHPEYQTLVLQYAQKLLSLRMAHAEKGYANTLMRPDSISRRGESLRAEKSEPVYSLASS